MKIVNYNSCRKRQLLFFKKNKKIKKTVDKTTS